MHRAAEILESEKSGMQLAGEATDLIQDVLGALSLIPVVGDVAAGLDAGIDFARGNPVAALSRSPRCFRSSVNRPPS